MGDVCGKYWQHLSLWGIRFIKVFVGFFDFHVYRAGFGIFSGFLYVEVFEVDLI